MSQTFTYTRDVRVANLFSELAAANVQLLRVDGNSGANQTFRVIVSDSQAQAAVTTVVNAHNPAAIDAAEAAKATQLAQDQAADTADKTALATAINQLNTYIALATPTAAQTTAIVQLIAKGLVFLLRREARRSL